MIGLVVKQIARRIVRPALPLVTAVISRREVARLAPVSSGARGQIIPYVILMRVAVRAGLRKRHTDPGVIVGCLPCVGPENRPIRIISFSKDQGYLASRHIIFYIPPL